MTAGFRFDDAGSPFKPRGDCVIRAIAIAMKRDYREVLDDIKAFIADYAANRRDSVARKLRTSAYKRNPRNGMFTKITRAYMESKGWRWTATMGIGTGCRVHLREDDLPSGRLVVKVTGHVTAVVDGIVHDVDDCRRGGTRCVYGYYSNDDPADGNLA